MPPKDPGSNGWLSIPEAASELGLSELAIYRHIATHSLQARRDHEGTLRVLFEDGMELREAIGARRSSDDLDEAPLRPSAPLTLTEFAIGLMEPLLARLAEQEAIIRQQAEELGRLRGQAELSRLPTPRRSSARRRS